MKRVALVKRLLTALMIHCLFTLFLARAWNALKLGTNEILLLSKDLTDVFDKV